MLMGANAGLSKLAWIALSLLTLPVISMAQQIAVSSGYPIPSANSSPSGITAGPDGALWFTESSGNKIGRITTAGFLTEFSLPTAASNPYGITAGPDGALWFIENSFNANKIGRITTAGVITEYPVPTANSFANAFPSWITVGPDGALWFTENFGVGIGRITTAGVITEYPLLSSSGGYPVGITAGPDSALWFTELFGNNIGRITTGGAITEYAVPTLHSWPLGITAGPDGALWFTENFGNKVGRITTAGAIIEYPVPTSLSGATWIRAGPDGALWFTENSENRIGRITTAGAITEYAVPIIGLGPVGITTGPDGELWFTQTQGNRIGELFFLTATLGITPGTGAVGAKITFTGSGFAPNETVQIYHGGVSSAVLASGTADSSGSIAIAARVPPWVYGSRLFVGVGQASGKLGATYFFTSARLFLQPTSGPVGATVTAQGTGFGSLEQLYISWSHPTILVGTVTADVNGAFNGSSAVTFTVPSGSPSGMNKVEAFGKTTTATAYVSFTVQ